MVRSLLLLASLVALSYALTCKSCTSSIVKIEGHPLGSRSEEDLQCVTKTCESDEDICAYGYATVGYKTAFSLTEEEEDAPEVDMEIVIDWMKDCGKSAEVKCENLKDMMKLELGADSKVSVSKCDMKTCTTDNCNDKTVAEINPDPIEEISCYTCKKSTVDGKANPDTEDPDQPECSESHKEKCPFGTEFCLSGNMVATMGGQEMELEYIKECGSGPMRSCEAYEETLKDYLGADSMKIASCNINACEGNLCNTMTAAEVKAYSSGTTHVLSCFLASLLVYLWV